MKRENLARLSDGPEKAFAVKALPTSPRPPVIMSQGIVLECVSAGGTR